MAKKNIFLKERVSEVLFLRAVQSALLGLLEYLFLTLHKVAVGTRALTSLAARPISGRSILTVPSTMKLYLYCKEHVL